MEEFSEFIPIALSRILSELRDVKLTCVKEGKVLMLQPSKFNESNEGNMLIEFQISLVSSITNLERSILFKEENLDIQLKLSTLKSFPGPITEA